MDWILLIPIISISLGVGFLGYLIGALLNKKRSRKQPGQYLQYISPVFKAEKLTDGSEESQRQFGISPTIVDEVVKKGHSLRK